MTPFYGHIVIAFSADPFRLSVRLSAYFIAAGNEEIKMNFAAGGLHNLTHSINVVFVHAGVRASHIESNCITIKKHGSL